MQTVLVCLALFGTVAIAAGIIIALLASRKAPDGFEDQTGFHTGRRTETFVDGLKSYGWLSDEPTSAKVVPPGPPQAR